MSDELAEELLCGLCDNGTRACVCDGKRGQVLTDEEFIRALERREQQESNDGR
jgi:hypothetical protein